MYNSFLHGKDDLCLRIRLNRKADACGSGSPIFSVSADTWKVVRVKMMIRRTAFIFVVSSLDDNLNEFRKSFWNVVCDYWRI